MNIDEKKKILLFNPPGKHIYLRDYFCSHSSKARYYWGPFDLIVLSGILKNKFELKALDCIAENHSKDSIKDIIFNDNFYAVIFLTGAVSWEEDFALIREINNESGKNILWIGIGDILFAEDKRALDMFSYLNAIILDFTSLEILEYLEGRLKKFDSISYRNENKEIVTATRNFTKEEFSLPIPDYSLFPYKKYRIPHGRRVPYAGFLTDYGCPYHCDYCIGGEIGFKLRNIDNTIEEMKFLKKIGIRELWIKDLTFGANKKRTTDLLNQMISEKLNFSWVCLSRANVLNEDILRLMKKAGCHTIQLGVETANDEVLSQYSKGVSRQQVRNAIGLCKKIGIRILAHYILGLPGETENDIEQTIKFAIELDTEIASFNVAMPRMGTKFRERAIKEGIISDDLVTLDNSISFPIMETNNLSKEKLWELRNKAIRKYHLRFSFILKKLFHVRSLYELKTLFVEGFSLIATTFGASSE